MQNTAGTSANLNNLIPANSLVSGLGSVFGIIVTIVLVLIGIKLLSMIFTFRTSRKQTKEMSNSLQTIQQMIMMMFAGNPMIAQFMGAGLGSTNPKKSKLGQKIEEVPTYVWVFVFAVFFMSSAFLFGPQIRLFFKIGPINYVRALLM